MFINPNAYYAMYKDRKQKYKNLFLCIYMFKLNNNFYNCTDINVKGFWPFWNTLYLPGEYGDVNVPHESKTPLTGKQYC